MAALGADEDSAASRAANDALDRMRHRAAQSRGLVGGVEEGSALATEVLERLSGKAGRFFQYLHSAIDITMGYAPPQVSIRHEHRHE
jgi:hypothetical protein